MFRREQKRFGWMMNREAKRSGPKDLMVDFHEKKVQRQGAVSFYSSIVAFCDAKRIMIGSTKAYQDKLRFMCETYLALKVIYFHMKGLRTLILNLRGNRWYKDLQEEWYLKRTNWTAAYAIIYSSCTSLSFIVPSLRLDVQKLWPNSTARFSCCAAKQPSRGGYKASVSIAMHGVLWHCYVINSWAFLLALCCVCRTYRV